MTQKVAVFTRNTSFLKPILNALEKRDTIVRIVSVLMQDLRNAVEEQCDLMIMWDHLKWADYAFFDFVHPPIEMASNLATLDARITTRLHGLEVYDRERLRMINWNKVHLVTSPPSYLRFIREYRNLRPASVTQVPLGVDVAPTKTKRKTIGHNIGIVAFSALPRKRIYTTVESFVDLMEHSANEWNLFIRTGEVRNWRPHQVKEYLKFIAEFRAELARVGIEDHVEFLGYMEEPVYQKWLRGIDITISNSMQEGYHHSILEAAAHGAWPLVHQWFGAFKVYPESNLFLTQRQLVDKILDWDEQSMATKRRLSREVQTWVQQSHNQDVWADKVVDVILGEASE